MSPAGSGPAALVMVSLAACASGVQPAAQSPSRADLQAHGQSTSDFLADPVFAPPPPSDEAHTGTASGAVVSGGVDQARRVALQIVDALRHADAAALEQAFADPVLRVRADRYILRGRLSSQCLHAAAPLGWHADSALSQVVELEHISVEALRTDPDGDALPPGLLPRDFRVRVPLVVGPRQRTRELPCLSHIYVRTGPSPVVVAID